MTDSLTHHTSSGSPTREVMASVRYSLDRAAYETSLVEPREALRPPSVRSPHRYRAQYVPVENEQAMHYLYKMHHVMAHLPHESVTTALVALEMARYAKPICACRPSGRLGLPRETTHGRALAHFVVFHDQGSTPSRGRGPLRVMNRR